MQHYIIKPRVVLLVFQKTAGFVSVVFETSVQSVVSHLAV